MLRTNKIYNTVTALMPSTDITHRTTSVCITTTCTQYANRVLSIASDAICTVITMKRTHKAFQKATRKLTVWRKNR